LIRKTTGDAQGQQLLTEYLTRNAAPEIIERDDGYIATGSAPGLYFSDFATWPHIEQQGIELARGRALDIGCGAGRHALYLQTKGLDVTGIDSSPGAIKVCKLRGLKKARLLPISGVGAFGAGSFDTVVMLGNNFGLFAGARQAAIILKKLHKVTSPGAAIIASSANPYDTTGPDHLAYHKLNRKRGRMPGQLRIRVRFGKTIGPWFDYLLVSREEMKIILKGTGWSVKEVFSGDGPRYVATIQKETTSKSKRPPYE
jgi:SAM-dependent methyltransferase